MIVATVCRKNDEWYTPRSAVDLILPYISPTARVWCPFDTEDSEFVRAFRERGNEVVATHVSTGGDFFKIEPPPCDIIVSNPPFSVKTKVFKRLFEIGRPFAMLVGVAGLFEYQRFDVFRKKYVELLIPRKRVKYMNGEKIGTPPFSSWYVCNGVLPNQITFELEVE